MSFIFSRALVEASLPDSCSDADAFVPSNESPTPKPSSLPDKTMARSPLSRFGMTCELLTDDRGADLLTSWLAAFPAKISALPAQESGLTESAAGFGPKWRGSFAKYDPAESKWRTHQCSLLGGLDEFSETWPRWGSMRAGECYLLPMSALPTFESESGSPEKFPTPIRNDAEKRGNFDPVRSYGLAGHVKIWPTPCASASKGSSPKALVRKSGKSRATDRIDHAVMSSDGGQLNPQWVEWLMGWPIGHTALEPLETAKYQKWLQQHGAS